MGVPRQSTPSLDQIHALVQSYCDLGWRVLPMRGKVPQLKEWPRRASSDADSVLQWFPKPLNVGIATGLKSGIVVIDVDPRNGGELAFERLKRELGDLPSTITARSGGGGEHYVFQWFEGARKHTPAEGVDFLADGACFVVAPSIHPDSGHAYEWLVSPWEAQPAALPDAWLSHLKASDSSPEADSGPILEGERNRTLFALGSQWRKDGVSTQKLISLLHETNLDRCQPPLCDDEVNRIYEQCLAYDTSNQSLLTRWQQGVIADKEISPTGKIVLLGLATYADQHGHSCHPNIDQVAERTNTSAKTVGKYLKDQEGVWFTRYTRPKSGQGFSYGYMLKLKYR